VSGGLAEGTETKIPGGRSGVAERLIKKLGMSLAEVARLFFEDYHLKCGIEI
jgi:hypothetical protein